MCLALIGLEECMGYPRTGVICLVCYCVGADGNENQVPVQEQQVFLTTEQSFPHLISFYKNIYSHYVKILYIHVSLCGYIHTSTDAYESWRLQISWI